MLELDPNAKELKRRRGKNKQQVNLEHENNMVGGKAVATSSTAELNDSFSLELPGLRVKLGGSDSHQRDEGN